MINDKLSTATGKICPLLPARKTKQNKAKKKNKKKQEISH